MKITLNHSKLAQALSYTSKAVSLKPNIPILSNVLLEVKNNTLKLSATNLDMGINMWIPGQSKADGSTTINGKYIADFVSASSGDRVDLEVEGNNLLVQTEHSNAQFAVMEAKEFPVLPAVGEKPIFKIEKDEFVVSMDKVLFACSTDMTAGRIQQSGVLFDINKEKGDVVSFIGLDGFRLSKRDSAISEFDSSLEKSEIIVPAKFLSELVKILADYNDVETIEVYLSESGSQIIFKFEDIEFSVRLLEGPYPDYRRIMPDSSSYTFEVKKSELENAIKVVNTFARGNLGNKTLFDFNLEEHKVTLVSTVTDIGEGKSEFVVSNVEGESDLNTAYTLRYLQDVVTHAKGQDIIFETKGPLAASVFKDKADSKFVHLIMPMRREV